MLKVTYRLKLGQDEFELQSEVKDEKDFFEQMSFYSNLPKTAPGGAADLKLVFRTTKKGHKYYSLVSEKEKMEFKFGQNLEANGGGLFPKGWEKLYEGADQDDQPQQRPAAPVVIGQQQAAPQPQTQFIAPPIAAPAQQQAPAPIQAPVFVAPQVTMPAPSVAPVQAPVMPTPAAVPQQAAAPAVNPNVQAVATNVLARFGIPQNK
jgi:hypothetical protein